MDQPNRRTEKVEVPTRPNQERLPTRKFPEQTFGDVLPVEHDLLQRVVAAVEERKGTSVDTLVVVKVEAWNVDKKNGEWSLSPRRASVKEWYFTDEFPVHARATRVRTMATEAYKFAEGVSQR